MSIEEATKIWNQKQIPVVIRSKEKGVRLKVRLPYDSNNKLWLINSRRDYVQWINKTRHWELPKSWFDDFVDRALRKYGKLWVIQPYREQEKCSPACQNARGHECQCSCMGQYHGTGFDGSWFEVSETFAFRRGDLDFACRLMTEKENHKQFG